MKDHHINIFWSDEDVEHSRHSGSAVLLKRQEALAELLIAKEAWLEVAREDAVDPIPEPSYRPLIYQVAG